MTEPDSSNSTATDPGQLVRLFRKITGQSLQQFATKADLDPTILSRIENGKRRISARTAERIGRAFFADESE